MASKIIYRERKFLNQLGFHSGAFIFAEITRETFKGRTKKNKDKTYTHRYCTLNIADCSRIINLDLDLDTIGSANNSVRKLDILIKTLGFYREALQRELAVMKRDKELKGKSGRSL